MTADERLECIADAIDEARYLHPEHPRERPRPFSEADLGDREYALRLALAALRAAEQPANLTEIAQGVRNLMRVGVGEGHEAWNRPLNAVLQLLKQGRAEQPAPERRETPEDGRRKGKSRLVYNKATRTIDTVPSHPADAEYDVRADVRQAIARKRICDNADAVAGELARLSSDLSAAREQIGEANAETVKTQDELGALLHAAEAERDASLQDAARLREAAEDALSGWRYIRENHGDLYGVGWDRVQDNLTAAIRAASLVRE